MNAFTFSRTALVLSALAFAGAASAASARTYATKASFSGEVQVGGAIMIGPFTSLNLDCTPSTYAGIRVLSGPRKGRVSTSIGRGDGNFPRGHKYEKCNFMPQNGPMVDYYPKPGASGVDKFRFLLLFGDGERRTVDVNVRIR